MPNHRFTSNFVACAVAAVAFAATAQAQNNRTFVATTGSDSNNCGPTTPCRTFAAALALTNPGGELVVLTSGGYGPATISEPVVITAIGIDASITQATSGQVGLTINTTGNVTLNGLNLNGNGTGQAGIDVESVGILRLYNMQIQNFTGPCIYFGSSGNMAVYDSKANDCLNGLVVNTSAAEVYVHNSAFDHNSTCGAIAFSGKLTVADSSAHYNDCGFSAAGGAVVLDGDRMAFNGTGMTVTSGSLNFANCLISGNGSSYVISGGTMAGSSPGTSLIAPGQGTTGALSTATTLQ